MVRVCEIEAFQLGSQWSQITGWSSQNSFVLPSRCSFADLWFLSRLWECLAGCKLVWDRIRFILLSSINIQIQVVTSRVPVGNGPHLPGGLCLQPWVQPLWGPFCNLAAETKTFITYKSSLPTLNVIIFTASSFKQRQEEKRLSGGYRSSPQVEALLVAGSYWYC